MELKMCEEININVLKIIISISKHVKQEKCPVHVYIYCELCTDTVHTAVIYFSKYMFESSKV